MHAIKKFTEEPTADEIRKVHEQIAPYINRTPVLTSSFFNQKTGASLFFKCENFQKIGAFKMRGAASATLALSENERKKRCGHPFLWKSCSGRSSGGQRAWNESLYRHA